ncbi:MAG: DEAD/DEAH box helicase [Betaproteobacteria bacterium]|nr:DEAD/DEAH box helicase [Betaproteobacteria bacterium]
MQFKELGLADELLRAIEDQGYTEPTPIQAKAIPPIMMGKDVMGAAQTGTGKTAGFTLPLLQRLKGYGNTSMSPARHPVRALILTPTRELAAQVWESVRAYGKYLPLRSTVVFGGVDIDPQIKDLRAGVEILVATPGRLLDHVQQKTVQLGQVEFLILDEADRMLDMGFMPDLKRILSLLPKARQNLLFSATFSEEIRKLADGLLNDPILVEVARRNSVTETVTHSVYRVQESAKREMLARLVNHLELRQVLVFVRTRFGANRLAHQLVRDGLNATAIHSNRTQAERMEALQDFKDGKVRVLVATDIAARGLDIEQLPCVINFELPHTPEDYVHRIGRTGRAGQAGEAISLVSREEQELLERIEKLLKTKIPERHLDGFDGSAATRRHERPGGGGGSRPDSRSESRADSPRSPVPRSKVPEDPFFQQPYEPRAGSPAASPASPAPAARATTTARNAPRRPVAALLAPRPGTPTTRR